MKYLGELVSPEAVPELIASTILAVVPWAREAGLKLPTGRFVRELRTELGVLARTDAALAIGEAERVSCVGMDGTPVDQDAVATVGGRVVNADGSEASTTYSPRSMLVNTTFPLPKYG